MSSIHGISRRWSASIIARPKTESSVTKKLRQEQILDLLPTGIISSVVLFLGPLHDLNVVIIVGEIETVHRTYDIENRLSEDDVESGVYTM